LEFSGIQGDVSMTMAENRPGIENRVITVANEMVSDWGLDLPGGITRDTRLMEDLNFESIDIVQFAVGIERAFDRKGLPFERLFMKDGAYVEDVSVSEVTDFLCAELDAAA
jgi:acyl carrier protein